MLTRGITLLLAAGMFQHANAQSPAASQPDPVRQHSVSVPRAERQEIRAQLVPLRYSTLASEIGARIVRIPFGEAQSFRSGDVLAALDCSIQTANRDRARAELHGAEATLRANERLASLNSIGELEVMLSATAVAKARAELQAHEALIKKCTVVAPYNGRIADQRVREQQFVQPGQALFEIIDDSELEIEFLAPSNWLIWLRLGYPMRIAIDETRKAYPARIQRIGARVDPVAQSIKVVARIDGRFTELIAGMSGRVEIAPPRP